MTPTPLLPSHVYINSLLRPISSYNIPFGKSIDTTIVLIPNGNPEHFTRKKSLFREKKIRFVAALDLSKCLKQITNIMLPSNISTMTNADDSFHSSNQTTQNPLLPPPQPLQSRRQSPHRRL